MLYWIRQGKQNAEIAGLVGIARGTVKKHVEHILSKLGVETRGAAAQTGPDWRERVCRGKG